MEPSRAQYLDADASVAQCGSCVCRVQNMTKVCFFVAVEPINLMPYLISIEVFNVHDRDNVIDAVSVGFVVTRKLFLAQNQTIRNMRFMQLYEKRADSLMPLIQALNDNKQGYLAERLQVEPTTDANAASSAINQGN